ncbi:MAG TPA: hypothetical protein VF627_11660, partial [Abditibacterium sp.]
RPRRAAPGSFFGVGHSKWPIVRKITRRRRTNSQGMKFFGQKQDSKTVPRVPYESQAIQKAGIYLF